MTEVGILFMGFGIGLGLGLLHAAGWRYTAREWEQVAARWRANAQGYEALFDTLTGERGPDRPRPRLVPPPE